MSQPITPSNSQHFGIGFKIHASDLGSQTLQSRPHRTNAHALGGGVGAIDAWLYFFVCFRRLPSQPKGLAFAQWKYFSPCGLNVSTILNELHVLVGVPNAAIRSQPAGNQD